MEEDDKENLLEKGNSIVQIKSEKITDEKPKIANGFGFFIEFKDRIIPRKNFLLTSYHLLDEEDIKSKKEIKIIQNNSEKIIDMTKDRKKYFNKNLDYTCIEILEEDKDGIESDIFLEIEYDVIEEEYESFNNNEIFVLQNLSEKEPSFSSGRILSMEKNKMTHDCNLAENSSGLPLLSKDMNFAILGMQKGFDADNKVNIATPIRDIIEDIKYHMCPFICTDEVDIFYLSRETIKILMKFPKIEDNSMLSICTQKFNYSINKLVIDFVRNFHGWELSDNYQEEIMHKFARKTKILFDSNKDDDTILNVMSKVYGKSNLAFYHSFSTFWQKSDTDDKMVNSRDLIFINGKIEFNNKSNFEFENNDTFLFGNYENLDEEEYSFTSFQNQNVSIYVKNKGDTIYAVFYRDCSDHFEIKTIVKIQNHFMKNNIVYANNVYIGETIENSESLEKKYLNRVEEWFEGLDKKEEKKEGEDEEEEENREKIKNEINFKELIIYQIEE